MNLEINTFAAFELELLGVGNKFIIIQSHLIIL